MALNLGDLVLTGDLPAANSRQRQPLCYSVANAIGRYVAMCDQTRANGAPAEMTVGMMLMAARKEELEAAAVASDDSDSSEIDDSGDEDDDDDDDSDDEDGRAPPRPARAAADAPDFDAHWAALAKLGWMLKSDGDLSSFTAARLKRDGTYQKARAALRVLIAFLADASENEFVRGASLNTKCQILALGRDAAAEAFKSIGLFRFLEKELQPVNLAAIMRLG